MALNPDASSYYPNGYDHFPLLPYSSSETYFFPPSPPSYMYQNINLQPQNVIYCSFPPLLPPHLAVYCFSPCGTISYYTFPRAKQLVESQGFPRLPPPPQFSLEEEEKVGDQNGRMPVLEVRQEVEKEGSTENCSLTRKSRAKFFKRACVIKSGKTKFTTQRIHGEELEEGSWKTTVMMKNIPNKFTKAKVLEILDAHCIRENEKLRFEEINDNLSFSEYNFLYLPIDFRTGSNKGYAFVNFTSPVAAQRFHREFEMKSWSEYGSGKVCEITPACYQGLSALKNHFKNSAFYCDSDDYLPVWFTPSRNGLLQSEEHFAASRFPKKA